MNKAKKIIFKTAFTIILGTTVISSEVFAQSAASIAARVAAAQAAQENNSRTESRASSNSDQSNRSDQQNRDSDQARTSNNTRNSSNDRSSDSNRSANQNNTRTSYLNNRNDYSRTTNRTSVSNRSSYGSSYDRSRYYPITVRSNNYFYRDGRYYSNRSGRYISVSAPIGARVSFLPNSAISIVYGNSRYFRVGLTWYLGRSNYYEVIERPPVIVEQQVLVEQPQYPDTYEENIQPGYEEQRPNLVIYPASGQSENQQDKDNYECYRWSKNESNYDPTEPYQDLNNKDLYVRAMTACMESRGYTVR